MLAGEVEIHRDQYQAFVRGTSIDLTRREFELIELLASSGGRVLEREFIYQRLWGYAMVRGDRSVDVFVRKLRQKLERVSPGWRYIHTHFGIGYRFAAEPAGGFRAPPAPPPRRCSSQSPAMSWISRGPSSAISVPPPIAASPPFLISTRAPVSAADEPREVGLVPDEQQRRAGRSPAQQLAARRARRSRPRAARRPPARGRAARRRASRCRAPARAGS